jgi:hypothetical protein
MMRMRTLYILAAVLGALVLASGVGDFFYASKVAETQVRFQNSICTLQRQQAKAGKGFYRLLKTLEARAVARESVDRKAGNLSEAAADADSARLYATVLAAAKQPSPAHSIC